MTVILVLSLLANVAAAMIIIAMTLRIKRLEYRIVVVRDKWIAASEEERDRYRLTLLNIDATGRKWAVAQGGNTPLALICRIAREGLRMESEQVDAEVLKINPQWAEIKAVPPGPSQSDLEKATAEAEALCMTHEAKIEELNSEVKRLKAEKQDVESQNSSRGKDCVRMNAEIERLQAELAAAKELEFSRCSPAVQKAFARFLAELARREAEKGNIE